jgi:DNA repair protein RadC
LANQLVSSFGGLGPLLEAPPEVLRREGLTDGVIGALAIARATALRLLETAPKAARRFPAGTRLAIICKRR